MDFLLNQDQQRWRDLAREFTKKFIKPDVIRRDRLSTAAERIPWDWIREAGKQGIRTMGVPKQFGGAGCDIFTMYLVGEMCLLCASQAIANQGHAALYGF